MTPEAIIGVVVAAVAAGGLVAMLVPKRTPPSRVFQCARCATAARHDDRTTEAWRSGKTRFFCRACHGAWLQSHPPQSASTRGRGSTSAEGSSGCLGVLALFALVPPLLFFLAPHGPGVRAADPCGYEVDAMLALDENSFDQDLSAGGGGWRAIANVPGCELAAADLLALYRQRHSGSGSLLLWHEGQLRASAGRYEEAIPLLDRARKPVEQDRMGWNHYVDATVAFLRHDRPALTAARERLASVPYPEGAGMPPLKDGHIEFPARPGQPAMRLRWPPNLDVVDGFVACFDKPYSVAYATACRAPGT